jgi:hypothetical protein
MKPTFLHQILVTAILLLQANAVMSAQNDKTIGRFSVNVGVSGIPLHAFLDAGYSIGEKIMREPEYLTEVYMNDTRSKTFGTYSIDASCQLGRRWAVLLNAGYSRLEADFYDIVSGQHLKSEADNIFSILAGGRYYWMSTRSHKLYSSVYMGVMLHDSSLDYWKRSNYDNDLFGFQITLFGWQFGKGRIYGVLEAGCGDLYIGIIPLGTRLGFGYRL